MNGADDRLSGEFSEFVHLLGLCTLINCIVVNPWESLRSWALITALFTLHGCMANPSGGSIKTQRVWSLVLEQEWSLSFSVLSLYRPTNSGVWPVRPTKCVREGVCQPASAAMCIPSCWKSVFECAVTTRLFSAMLLLGSRTKSL